MLSHAQTGMLDVLLNLLIATSLRVTMQYDRCPGTVTDARFQPEQEYTLSTLAFFHLKD